MPVSLSPPARKSRDFELTITSIGFLYPEIGRLYSKVYDLYSSWLLSFKDGLNGMGPKAHIFFHCFLGYHSWVRVVESALTSANRGQREDSGPAHAPPSYES